MKIRHHKKVILKLFEIIAIFLENRQNSLNNQNKTPNQKNKKMETSL